MPIFKGFKGHIVKSIGDALLVTFKSPTDAMLCSMSLQDAMHSYNLTVVEDEKIHIRVAANLGEVRVTKNDIFGEPVNITSRIEGITPTDEIYLSEALYMSMNKAEVPAKEVGFKELAGVSQSVRIYNIPRFSVHRLIPIKTNSATGEQGNEILYPYGGMHYQVMSFESPFSANLFRKNKFLWFFITLSVFLVLLYLVLTKYQDLYTPTAKEFNTVTSDSLVNEHSENQTEDKPVEKVEVKSTKPSVPKAITSKPIVQSKRAPIKWNIATAKSAYRANRLSKVDYKKIVYDLKIAYKNKVRQLKTAYRNKEITKVQYIQAVNKAKKAMEGR